MKLLPFLYLIGQISSRPQRFGNPDEWGPYFEGDIQLPKFRNGLSNEIFRWPDGIVPYVFDVSFRRKRRVVVMEAMQNLTEATKGCIKFVHKRKEEEEDYITFRNQDEGCWSHVGRIGGKQTVNLADECTDVFGVVLHELVHALGFLHEHSRPDRDDYITIMEKNIKEGCKGNFEKFKWNKVRTFSVRYDYLSLMHYSARACSNNGNLTIETKDPKFQNEIGQRRNLSSSDVKKLFKMYKCDTITN